MNKNAIKKFAIDARNKLIASVTDKAGMLGITANGISDVITKGRDFEVYKTSAGTEVTLNRTQSEQRRRLVAQIEARGFEAVIEEVAYTWFNRICAIRFMEVNDYLPVRVLSSIKDGKTEPDIVTNAPDVDIDFTDAENSFILEAKVGNKLDGLFRMLFIKQCHELNDILPELFEKTEDYTEMLLNISYTNEDDVIRMLVDTVDEKDFNVTTLGDDGKPTGQVEIIGWLYQYYNTELKDDTFAKLKKNVKITKERIPAATQLFTPDWIVRYMVENSVGRIWIEHLRAVDPSVDEKVTAENFGWKYYLPEAEQEESVNVKLAEIRTSYANLKPEDITCIDPCMGSGHILIAMFDVLMDIYKSTGYSEKEAAFSIVENNIHGLDIDKRAYQLAYFAVMMKGRGYNRRFFRGHDDMKPQPKVYAIQESNGINRVHIKYFGAGLSAIEKNNALNQIDGLLHVMTDAREYGSILNVDNYDWGLLRRFVAESGEENQLTLETIGIEQTKDQLNKILQIGEVMSRKYYCAITNPPYMSARGSMSSKLTAFLTKNYPLTKNDMFTVFMDVCRNMTKNNAFYTLVNQQSWMFLAGFAKMREELYANNQIINLIHIGTGAFEGIAGEVVQSVAFCVRRGANLSYKAKCVKMLDGGWKRYTDSFANIDQSYEIALSEIRDIPSGIYCYWLGGKAIEKYYMGKRLDSFADPRVGMATGDNDKFVRLWFEVAKDNIGLGFKKADETAGAPTRWYPYNKGGECRRWYGNRTHVVDWYNNGQNINAFKQGRLARGEIEKKNSECWNREYYFMESISWSKVSSGRYALRYYEDGFIFDVAGCSILGLKGNLKYILGALNSELRNAYIESLSPTLNFETGAIKAFPIIYDGEKKERVEAIVDECISIAKKDWDNFELSWDFKKSPLLNGERTVAEAYKKWEQESDAAFERMRILEEELNSIFIRIYELEGELSAVVNENDITLKKADLERDIKGLISYAVGCMFGRYSLDVDGIRCTSNALQDEYKMFKPDADNIIPIMDDEYFEDDIVGLFCNWLKIVYGSETLEENLEFIANVLGGKGNTARETIRTYFLNDFYKDHCSTFSVTGSGKRPIYWLFDSGKQNGFKCLIYIHRYDRDIVGRIRTEYLHKAQYAIEQALLTAERIRDNSNSGNDKGNATKSITKYMKQLAELTQYDEAIAFVAGKRIDIDINDGVQSNYEKLQQIEISKEGQKAVVVNLLAKI